MQDVTLHLGDCLEYMRSLPDGCVDAVITDPPYGIAYQSARRIDKLDRFAVLFGDTVLDTSWLKGAERVLRDTSCAFVFCRWDTQNTFRQSIGELLTVKSQVIWDRVVHGLGDLVAQYAPCHDVAWFATKGGYFFPGRRPQSVYRVARVAACDLTHPTEKPLALMVRIVKDLTRPGDIVFDPFMGSGTTGVACVQTGRKFIGCEIDSGYFAIAEKRIREAQAQPRLPFEEQPEKHEQHAMEFV